MGQKIRHSAEDDLFRGSLTKLKKSYPRIQRILVLAYLNRPINTDFFDSTAYPPLETVPPRYAIVKRNQWMADVADVVVAYVTHGWGGAAKTLQYAKKKKKTILLYPNQPSR